MTNIPIRIVSPPQVLSLIVFAPFKFPPYYRRKDVDDAVGTLSKGKHIPAVCEYLLPKDLQTLPDTWASLEYVTKVFRGEVQGIAVGQVYVLGDVSTEPVRELILNAFYHRIDVVDNVTNKYLPLSRFIAMARNYNAQVTA